MTQSRTPRTRRSAKAETAPAAPAAPKVAAAAPPKPRSRTKAAPAPAPVVAPVVDLRTQAPVEEQIAVAAYLMWEQGQPGDAAEHWYAAERLVRA